MDIFPSIVILEVKCPIIKCLKAKFFLFLGREQKPLERKETVFSSPFEFLTKKKMEFWFLFCEMKGNLDFTWICLDALYCFTGKDKGVQ